MFYSKMVLGGGGNVREGGSEGDGGGEDGVDEDGSNGNGTWMGAYGECGFTVIFGFLVIGKVYGGGGGGWWWVVL